MNETGRLEQSDAYWRLRAEWLRRMSERMELVALAPQPPFWEAVPFPAIDPDVLRRWRSQLMDSDRVRSGRERLGE